MGNQARSLEKSLGQLRLQKAQLSAAKRELAGQLAQITANTSSSLDREIKPLAKYIYWQGGDSKSLSPEVLRLPAPLFVLHQSMQLSAGAEMECSVVDLQQTRPLLTAFTAQWGLQCRIGRINFLVAFSSVLDLAVASGNHAELQQLGLEGDTGLVSPSLTTLVEKKNRCFLFLFYFLSVDEFSTRLA